MSQHGSQVLPITLLVESFQNMHRTLVKLNWLPERRVLNWSFTVELSSRTEMLSTLALTRGELTNDVNSSSSCSYHSSAVLRRQAG